MFFLRTELRELYSIFITKIEILAKYVLSKWYFHNSSFSHHHTAFHINVCFSFMFLIMGYIKNKIYPLPGTDALRKRFKTRLINNKFPKSKTLSSVHFSVLECATTKQKSEKCYYTQLN